MATTETLSMDITFMTEAVQGLVNLFLNMDGRSREMFIKLLVVKMEEEEVDLILEVVDMRNNSNTGVKIPSVKSDDIKKEAGQCFDDSDYAHNYKTETSNDKNTEDEKMELNNDGSGSLFKLKEEPELGCQTKNKPEDMNKMFVCEFCSKSFETKNNLKTHISRIHTKSKILNCDQCSYETSDPTSIKNHKRTHTGERPYVCHICSKTFTQNSHMNRHIKGVHMGEKCYMGGQNLLCNFCPMTFSSPHTLTIHKQSIHEGIKYDCDQCEYKASDRGNLARHVASIHEGIKFVCEECGYKASSKQILKTHQEAVHLGIRHECSQCDHKAATKSYLIQHVAAVHESIERNCKECNFTTYKKRAFLKHMTSHRQSQALQNQPDYSASQPFRMSVN